MTESVEVSLECDLLRGMGELLIAEPAAMPCAPRLSREAQVATEKESLDTDAVTPNVLAARVPCSDQIPQRLV